ncbi:EH domain-containing protein 3-like isoform X1 [Watersipora subatra]|uniref:EH domain-containing protein 3-like isoform X1 n=1 Tax=Watersipora subatra TaxID=2589382 RepID=UPI00355B0B9E
MFSFMKTKKTPEVYASVLDGLKSLYKKSLLPLEEMYSFHDFHSPKLGDADFDNKPMVMLIGQYSTGKTTFIKYLLEKEFPGCRIGPEPTTDRFIIIMNGEQDSVIPGNALVVDPKTPFKPLSKFGNAFLNRFQSSTTKSPVLETVTLIDTPGILAGEKQRIDRGYDFTEVLEWFAERVDRILLLFDAHKLDISDEFRRAIESVKTYEDKIRIILNKADMINAQQLMRVYGALMWSLGKILKTPEVCRVYIGSFWNQPLHFDENRKLFELEAADLFTDLQSLPKHNTLRKLNDFIRRARLAKVHAYIISHLKKEMPSMFGKDSKKKELINKLGEVYKQIQREYGISLGDFPNIDKMKMSLEVASVHDFKKFQPLKPRLMENVDKMLADEVSRLMAMVPTEETEMPAPNVQGGAFDGMQENPFNVGANEGINQGLYDDSDWIVSKDKDRYDKSFYALGPKDGKIAGGAAKTEMVKSRLPNSILAKVWKLADVDRDGMLDSEEWALANHLMGLKLEGHELPAELPVHLIPPSKRILHDD